MAQTRKCAPMKIKRYKLRYGANLSSVPRSEYLTYVHPDAVRGLRKGLVGGIEVVVTFPEDLFDWNDFDFVLVIDEEFGQPYTPFYSYLSGEIRSFPVLRKVIEKYNEFMSSLPFLEEKN